MVLQSDTTESSHQWNPADAWSSKTSLTAYVRSTCWLLRTSLAPRAVSLLLYTYSTRPYNFLTNAETLSQLHRLWPW